MPISSMMTFLLHVEVVVAQARLQDVGEDCPPPAARTPAGCRRRKTVFSSLVNAL